MNDLIPLEKTNALEIFTPQGTDDILARIKQTARSEVTDISTQAGRDRIKSLAYQIARSKTYLDDMGKELVSEQKKAIAQVDAERKRIRDELDALKDEIRAPLTEWENREEARFKAHESALVTFDTLAVFTEPHPSSGEVQKRLDSLAAAYDRDWQEFAKRAELAKDATHKRLSDILAASQKYEAEQAELERLRREDAERKQREHEERLKAEAAEKARKEAEEKARKEAEDEATRVKAEQERAEQERQRLEREAAEAEERARKAEEDRLAAIAQAEQAERDRIAAAEKADADRKAAEVKAEADRIAAAEKAERQRKEAVEAAAKRERERIAEEQRKREEEAAKREADKKHRAKINNEALDALLAVLTGDNLLTAEAAAKAVVSAIAKGEIAHVKISY